jgi:hypothetical protein
VNEVLDAMRAHYGELLVIHGCAVGADLCAARWAENHGLEHARIAALWGRHGKGAGFRRNSALAALRPHVCIAFPGGEGTADMAQKARDAGIPTYEV